MLGEKALGATKKGMDRNAGSQAPRQKVIGLSVRAYEQIAAPHDLCVFSMDLPVFVDGLTNEAMDFSILVEVFSRKAIDLSKLIHVISRRSMDKTHHSTA